MPVLNLHHGTAGLSHKKSIMNDEKGFASFKVIMILIMIVIALAGWGFAANLYEQANIVEGRFRGGVASAGFSAIVAFTINAVVAIPFAVRIVSVTLKERIWLPIGVIALEIGALIFWAWAKKFEEELYGPSRTRKKVKKR
jgi:hypothetical protein